MEIDRVCVVAVIGNALIVYVIARTPRLYNRCYVFMANLAVADM
jgi:hypothetical protein